MKVIDQFRPEDPACPRRLSRFDRSGEVSDFDTELLGEHVLDVYVNGALTMQLACTPEHLTELTLGRLLTEGVIRSADDVEQITLSEQGESARVLLTRERAAQPGFAPKPLTPARWTSEEVFLCADRFAADTPLHRRTRSTHSCFLLSGGEIVFVCEDIGRHNAVDKALGWALLHDVDLPSAALFTSGRVPTDMARKVICAGVSVFISKEAATREAVELAERFGLTILGKVRPESFVVYADGVKKE